MTHWRDNRIWLAFTTAWGISTAALWCILMLLFMPFVGPRRSYFGFGKFYVRQLFWVCGVKWDVKGWEELPEEIRTERQPAIFMSNHESHVDAPFLANAIPIPAVYIAKKELRLIPFLGWLIWAAGMIFIDRKNRERAVLSMKKAATEIHGGKSVVLFPEGTRTRTGELGPFKKGGFHLAMDAGVPIVPIAMVGGYQLLPPHSLQLRSGSYRARFGQPVDTTSFKDRDQLLEEVRKRIVELRELVKADAPI